MASPLPTNLAQFDARLPLQVPTRPDPTDELSYSFAKGTERGYAVGADQMYAAVYSASTGLSTVTFAVIVNELSGNVAEAVRAVASALAHQDAMVQGYLQQTPPLPVPDNPGTLAPLSGEALATLDGTARFRGMAAGLRSLDPALVPTVAVVVPAVW